MAEHNLGYARLLTGDLVGALRMIEQRPPRSSPLSAVNRATVEQDRAEILTAAGRPREAIRALEQAAQAYGSRRLRTYQAECELTLAWTMLREDPAKARVVARRAARRFRGQASPARELRADAAAIVAEIATGGRTPGHCWHASTAWRRASTSHGLRHDATRPAAARCAGQRGARRARRRAQPAASRAGGQLVPRHDTPALA